MYAGPLVGSLPAVLTAGLLIGSHNYVIRLKTTNSSTSENSWMPVIEYCDLYLSYSALSTAKLQTLSAQL